MALQIAVQSAAKPSIEKDHNASRGGSIVRYVKVVESAVLAVGQYNCRNFQMSGKCGGCNAERGR